jgi:metal transporter CNNM
MLTYLICIVLVALSALFSGLTLGLLSLDPHVLKRRAKHGDENAHIIYPVRKKGNLLLTSLLLGNVAVNTTLPIFLDTLMPGVFAIMIATGLIVVFGDVLPQAVFSRNALAFGAKTIWITKFVMFIFYPIAFPIAWLLDKLLGDEVPTMYSRHELMEIITEHKDSVDSTVDHDEERIVHGALMFSHIRVREVMTLAQDVISFDENQKLNDEFYERVGEAGFSRVPIYSGDPTNIVGVLFVKDLFNEDEDISIRETEEAFEGDYLTAKPDELLDVVLGRMLKRRQHLAVVRSRHEKFLGIITLEDIIEEIIQQEIEDEGDD